MKRRWQRLKNPAVAIFCMADKKEMSQTGKFNNNGMLSF